MTQAQAALQLFRGGNDTAEIAKRLRVTEATSSRLVWIARCEEKKLPAIWLDRFRHERKAVA